MKQLSLNKYFFLIVPLAYFFLGSYIHQIIGLYSLRAVDPEYIYFTSGLSIANGKLILGHIDNPGTPLQYLVAIVFKVLYQIRDHQTPFNEDVLSNADMYLRVLNLALIGVVSVFMYFAGKASFKITNSLSFSCLLQLSPFFTSIIYGNIGRISPENLIPIPVMLLSLLLLKLVYQPDEEQTKKHSILFGLISAFGLSIKLTYFPLWIIPLIVIKAWKNKLWYSASTIGFFFVIALPVTLQINIFWGWIKDLLLHSGHYGKGEQNIINWETVIPNFKCLWNENRYFFYVVIILFFCSIVSLFFQKSKKDRLINRISFAILSAIAIQIAIVCKQFEYRYFIPSLMLLPISGMLILIVISQPTSIVFSRYKISQVLAILFVSFYFIKQVPIIQNLSNYLEQEKPRKMPGWNYMASIEKDAIKFLVPSYYGCPAPEYSLMFSYNWSGKQHAFFKPILGKLYPQTYIYYPWDKTLNYWDQPPAIMGTEKSVYVYLENENLKETFLSDTKAYFPEKYTLVRTFFNELTKESVYKLVRINQEDMSGNKKL